MPQITKDTALTIIKTNIKVKNKENLKHIFYLLDAELSEQFDKFINLLLMEDEYEPLKYGQVFKTKIPKWQMTYEEDVLTELGLYYNGYVYGIITNPERTYSGDYMSHIYSHDENREVKIFPTSVKEQDMLKVDKSEPFHTLFKREIMGRVKPNEK